MEGSAVTMLVSFDKYVRALKLQQYAFQTIWSVDMAESDGEYATMRTSVSATIMLRLLDAAYLAYNCHDIVPFGGGTLPDGGAGTRRETCILEDAGVFGNILGSKLSNLSGSSLTDSRGRTRVKENEETVEPASEKHGFFNPNPEEEISHSHLPRTHA